MPRYDFVSPGGMAAQSLEEFFVQRELEKIEALRRESEMQRQQATIRQRDEELGLRRADQEAEAAKVRAQTERQAAQDAQATSTARNQAGVRDMVATRMGQGPLNPQDASSIIGMLYREDMPVPGVVDAAMQPPKEAAGFTLGQDQVRFDAQGKPIARGPRSPQPPSASTTTPGQDYTNERRTRVRQTIGEILGQKQPDGTYSGGLINSMTTGWGSLAANLPETDARQLRGKINTLKSGIAFGELTEMREASKTGGALGQVAIRELELLESSLGAIDQGLRDEHLIAELEKIDASLARWEAAKGGAAQPMRSSPEGAPAGKRFTIVSVK